MLGAPHAGAYDYSYMVSVCQFRGGGGTATLHLGDSAELYRGWPRPSTIISDGAYGLAKFPGDPRTHTSITEWYRPHIEFWSSLALPSTTLWFWNSEIGWATVHPLLESAGWVYKASNVWDKGMSHVAGNANTRTLRQFPVVTEVCVQYVRENRLSSSGAELPLKDWLRAEWLRSGIPFYRANEACGVKNAATRKYLTADHLWYFPPPDMFAMLADYANRHGDERGKPYFSADGKRSISADEWRLMRAKFSCPVGTTNVWQTAQLNGNERVRMSGSSSVVHVNQKPLSLMHLITAASSDSGDVIWEPFGGLCSGSVAAFRVGRHAYAAEIDKDYFQHACERFADEAASLTQEFDFEEEDERAYSTCTARSG